MEISGDNDSGVKGHLGKVSRKESDVTGECWSLGKLLSEDRCRLQIRQTRPVLRQAVSSFLHSASHRLVYGCEMPIVTIPFVSIK